MGSPALGASPQPDLNPGQGIGIGIGRGLECTNYDVEEVQKIANVLMVTLAEACVQKTVGDLFKAPGAVVAEVKKEMLDYLQQQSEIYANSPPKPPGTFMDPPSKIVSDLLEQFVKLKQNLFGKMSCRIKLGNKDDKVEAFLQELDRGGVWMPGRREVLARALVKRIDKTKVKHCGRKFDREEELHNHRLQCPIRPVQCVNEGCMEVFSAMFGEKHDGVCYFKPLHCRQKCGGLVRRGEMDVHVNTVCPMKLVSCPFEKLGCVEPVYQGQLVQHCEEFVPKHVMLILSAMQKQEGVAFSYGDRIAMLEKTMNIQARSEAVDVRNLTLNLREAEVKIATLEKEIKYLRDSLRGAESLPAEMLQLRREVSRLQKQGAAHQQLLQNPPGFAGGFVYPPPGRSGGV